MALGVKAAAVLRERELGEEGERVRSSSNGGLAGEGGEDLGLKAIVADTAVQRRPSPKESARGSGAGEQNAFCR